MVRQHHSYIVASVTALTTLVAVAPLAQAQPCARVTGSALLQRRLAASGVQITEQCSAVIVVQPSATGYTLQMSDEAQREQTVDVATIDDAATIAEAWLDRVVEVSPIPTSPVAQAAITLTEPTAPPTAPTAPIVPKADVSKAATLAPQPAPASLAAQPVWFHLAGEAAVSDGGALWLGIRATVGVLRGGLMFAAHQDSDWTGSLHNLGFARARVEAGAVARFSVGPGLLLPNLGVARRTVTVVPTTITGRGSETAWSGTAGISYAITTSVGPIRVGAGARIFVDWPSATFDYETASGPVSERATYFAGLSVAVFAP